MKNISNAIQLLLLSTEISLRAKQLNFFFLNKEIDHFKHVIFLGLFRLGEVLALEEGKEKSMTLAFFFFPLPCFLYQKEHVVKCLCHRHWPFLLVEKGAAVLWWPGGLEEIAARGCCPHGFTKQAAPAGKPVGLGLLTISSNLELRLSALWDLPFSFLFPSLFSSGAS